MDGRVEGMHITQNSTNVYLGITVRKPVVKILGLSVVYYRFMTLQLILLIVLLKKIILEQNQQTVTVLEPFCIQENRSRIIGLIFGQLSLYNAFLTVTALLLKIQVVLSGGFYLIPREKW